VKLPHVCPGRVPNLRLSVSTRHFGLTSLRLFATGPSPHRLHVSISSFSQFFHLFLLSQISEGCFPIRSIGPPPSTLFLQYPGVFSFLSHSIPGMNLNTTPLEGHLNPPLSPLPLIGCHSLNSHPSFFHLNHSQGDLGGAHLLSAPSPSIPFFYLLKSPRPHSYLNMCPILHSGSIHHSKY